MSRQRARRVYADALRKTGMPRAADSVESGFENVWIRPALDALEAALRQIADDDD